MWVRVPPPVPSQNTFASTETQRHVKPLRMIDEVCFEMATIKQTRLKMEKFTDVFAEITRLLAKLACAMFIAFLIGGISYCFASEPTALEREKARVQWIAEHGQYQPNLTEPAKQEALVYTEQKQAEINRTWSK